MTIQRALLGYHPTETYGLSKDWGKVVKLPQGIVIPWIVDHAVWRVTIRDERVAKGAGRYRQVAGGAHGLYLADALTLNRPAAVMVEGEFDALSLAQECGDLVAVVATGTTQGGHTPRWLSLLATQRRVFIAFDAQEQGDGAAVWWLQRLSNAQRLRPLWKDANQMLQDGADLRSWIASALPPLTREKQTPVALENTKELDAAGKGEKASFPPCPVPEPYRRFIEASQRLHLSPRTPLRVITPRGKGNLWQVLGNIRIGVVLDNDPQRVTFFWRPSEIEAIQPLEEMLAEIPHYLR
jgi:hypothetical protein